MAFMFGVKSTFIFYLAKGGVVRVARVARVARMVWVVWVVRARAIPAGI